ncbi:MAG: hypothetical protein H7339_12795 [Arcicella sp.]|nr:hypothetical protein [Arcicella sp.]
MKNIHSCTLIIAFLIIASTGFVSCNSDNETTNSKNVKSISARYLTPLPGNDANPYDEVGWLYNELFDKYYNDGNLGGSVSQIASKVQAVADSSDSFNAIKGELYHDVSSTRVVYLIENQTSCVKNVISATNMSTAGKSSLTDFINFFVVFLKTESDCNVIYQKVVDYEKEVLFNTLLTDTDKRIIFTTTSISRHLAYRINKKPKKNTDPDWTVLIGNFIASTEGAGNGPGEAVTFSLVTGIAQNQ